MYNPFSLEGKTILVTGASSGIGRATAIECSKLGAVVCVTGRDQGRLKETFVQLEGDGHFMIAADLVKDAEIERLVQELPILDGVVSNAGATKTIPMAYISRDKLMDLLEVNSIAPIILFQRLLKCKKIKKGASIVFTTSISGVFIAVPGNTIYSTTKGALNGFVKNAALDLAVKGIRVNAVCPGMIETHILDAGVLSDEDLKRERQKYPLQRFGRPEEVAYAIIYLLSDASSFTTGSNLLIDGGATLI